MQSQSGQTFDGFSKPEANFFRLPNEWTDITAQVTSLAEMKLVEYVLKHTWGYSEFDVVKKITTDEFMNGRKKKSGERVDNGTGLSKPSVIAGLKSAVKHGLLEEEIDDRDRARIKKYYKLKMRNPIEENEPEEKETKERYNNVNKQIKKEHEELDYYAGLLADKLGDQKSLTYYKIACRRFNPQLLMQKASEIMSDGGARNPGAIFVDWLKSKQTGTNSTNTSAPYTHEPSG